LLDLYILCKFIHILPQNSLGIYHHSVHMFRASEVQTASPLFPITESSFFFFKRSEHLLGPRGASCYG